MSSRTAVGADSAGSSAFWGVRYGQLRDLFGVTWSHGGPIAACLCVLRVFVVNHIFDHEDTKDTKSAGRT